MRVRQHPALSQDALTSGAEKNLALLPGVELRVSLTPPSGGGSRDPRVLLNEVVHRLDSHPPSNLDRVRTYDTYDGQNAGSGYDWYALHFPEPLMVNCIEMTMGYPHCDGGWWTSLNVEYQEDEGAPWQPVKELDITPPYPLDDTPVGRRPYEKHTLTFQSVLVRALRLIGCPGGCAHHTSLARIAVYMRNLSQWNPVERTDVPVPAIFRLIPPHIVFDLSENLMVLTGLRVDFHMMEYYLDAARYERFWQRVSRNYQGEPELWFLIGERVGWPYWNHINSGEEDPRNGEQQRAPYVQTFYHGILAHAVAPVVVDEQRLGKMSAGVAVVKDHYDPLWHRQHACELNIPWPEYQAALDRSPQMTVHQLQATAELLGLIANTIANLVHRLENADSEQDQRRQERKTLLRRSLDYMKDNLERHITIADVAHEIGLTVSYFSTLFTEEMGRNPSDYLIKLRIERAKEYFTHTSLPVIEVAARLGYDPSYFSRLFKRSTGVSPSHYALTVRQARE